MKIALKVMPGAKKKLWKEEGDQIKVYLTAPAVDNKANAALVKFISERFLVKQSAVEILQGHKSRHKVIFINK